MNSKNIPADISVKSIKEAQNEIKEIIEKLEDSKIKLEDSIEQYDRMIQLNQHIKEQFRKKVSEIRASTLDEDKKLSIKNLK